MTGVSEVSLIDDIYEGTFFIDGGAGRCELESSSRILAHKKQRNSRSSCNCMEGWLWLLEGDAIWCKFRPHACQSGMMSGGLFWWAVSHSTTTSSRTEERHERLEKGSVLKQQPAVVVSASIASGAASNFPVHSWWQGHPWMFAGEKICGQRFPIGGYSQRRWPVASSPTPQ